MRAADLASGDEAAGGGGEHVPGALVGEVARRHGLLPSQVTTWRRLYRQGELVPRGSPPLPPMVKGPVQAARASSDPDGGIDPPRAFVPLLVAGEHEPSGYGDLPSPPASSSTPSVHPDRIEIEVAGVMVRLPVDVPARHLEEVVRGLRDAIGGPSA